MFGEFGNDGHCARSGTAEAETMRAIRNRFTACIVTEQSAGCQSEFARPTLFISVPDLRDEEIDVALEAAGDGCGVRSDRTRPDAAAMHQRHLHEHGLIAIREFG